MRGCFGGNIYSILFYGQVLFHPNIYEDGGVCLSIINPPESMHGYGAGGDWKPSITIRQVLCMGDSSFRTRT